MKNRFFYICFLFTFLCWCIPFISRFFVLPKTIQLSEIETIKFEEINITNAVIDAFDNNDNKTAFVLIFKNNMKNCILNVVGGAMLGLGTFVNIIFNGFVSADIFASCYYSGLTVEEILKTTLPHSFELIGFWLSGATGFYIAWYIILMIRGKEIKSTQFYKIVGINFLIMFLITLSAAYVEAYITPQIA